MKSLFLIFAIFASISSNLSGQHNQLDNNKIEENVYEMILDTLVARKKFDFYFKELKHYDTKFYVDNPLDTLVLINPETYEDIKKQGIDLKIEEDSINFEEAKLFKQRIIFPNGMYLVGCLDQNHIEKKIDLQKIIALENYPDLGLLEAFDVTKLNDQKIGKHEVRLNNAENYKNYKYATKAIISFSSIQWDKEMKYGVVECGLHYRYKNMGTTGGGFLAILRRTDNKLEILKAISLWEE